MICSAEKVSLVKKTTEYSKIYYKLYVFLNILSLIKIAFTNLFDSIASFPSIVLPTMDSFYVFPCSNLHTFIQSRILVYRTFNIEILSFVFKIAFDVIKAVLLANGIEKFGLIRAIVQNTIV